ncbi:MAG: SDR family NAD(P)-dependent oxidoreductase [Acidobacteria bacterium]|nr:SDR family NAD(P)-dependent oxidoreductase [Acidobacteriota bacterium]
MRNVVITGASSGIGEALAIELAKRGWERIALLGRRAGALEGVAKEVMAHGSKPMPIESDVRDAQSVRDAVTRVEAEWGPVDLAVANAGIGFPTPAHRFSLDDARAIMQTNFDGMLHLWDAVSPKMLARYEGHFVAIASLAGLRGLPGGSVYAASKAAMQAWMEASRVELTGKGIAMTIVNPGFVATPMVEKNRFRMPFLMKTRDAVRKIADGIERRARVIEFPLGTSMLMRALRLVPVPLFDRLVRPWSRRRVDLERARH